jgi:hypothetical protein
MLLRNPVDRAFSHYQKERARGHESLSFDEAIAREPERLAGEEARMLADPSYYSYAFDHFSYASRGIYIDQLLRWGRFYSQDQMLILRSEDLFSDPARVYWSVQRFLGLPAHSLRTYPRRNVRPYQQLGDDTRAQLNDFFAPHNARLSEYLGFDPGWSGRRPGDGP